MFVTAMTKRKGEKGQTMNDKLLHMKL